MAVSAAGWLGEPLVLEVAAEALAAVRRAKSQARRSMRAPVARLRVVGAPERIEALRAVAADLRAAGAIAELDLEPGAVAATEVTLAEPG